jgi:FAD/FMN-containing dehydrogenase
MSVSSARPASTNYPAPGANGGCPERVTDREAGLLARLRAAVGPQHVLTDPELTESYSRDWTGRWSGKPLAVTRPGSTDEVSQVVRACTAAGTPLVPQGGNTGLVGAGVPGNGEVVLSTRRLRMLSPVDVHARTVRAGAGLTLAETQQHVRKAGLELGIDFGARGSATIGGIVATNAGGERVIRHGTTRHQVAGLEAVLADGTVVSRLSGFPKDNVGYDLVQLLVGSEGTLAVITEVVLHLVPYVRERAAALVALASIPDALSALRTLRARLPGLEAADYFHDDGLRLVLGRSDQRSPFPESYPMYLLVETAGADALDDLTSALTDLSEVRDAALAGPFSERRRLWALREGHTEAINAAGVPVKLDIAVLPARLEAFELSLPQVVNAAAPGSEIILFGHLAEGNIHVNVLGADSPEQHDAVTDAVLRHVVSFGGSISAEHGIGRAKQRWLPLARSDADVAAMTSIKQALDPAGILSPGRVLP